VNAEFHRYAVAVAIGVLIVITVGAYVTSEATAPHPPSRSLINASVHRMAGLAVLILTLFLAIWDTEAKEGFVLGWVALALVLSEALAGWLGQPLLHASVAPLAFGIVVAVVVLTSSSWNEAPELVSGHAAHLLRRFALAAPVLVLLQSGLGAAYRHKLTSVIPHLGGAMVVLLVTLIGAIQVTQQYPKHRALKSAATWLVSITLAQVALGVTAFAMRLLDVRNSTAVVISTASHVVVASLTLAASLVLAMQVQRCVRRQVAGVHVQAPEGDASPAPEHEA